MPDGKEAGVQRSSPRLRAVLLADAAWDTLLGLVFCLGAAGLLTAVGLPALRPWPLFAALGVACLAFAVILLLGARGPGAVALARLVALGNGGAAVIVAVAVVLIGGSAIPLSVVLAAAAIGCAVFAVLEWRAARVD